MIYRYHVYEAIAEKSFLAPQHHKDSLNSLLVGFPDKLLLVLDNAEVCNEIIDLEKQEVYLKITTEIEETEVANAMQSMLKMTGLNSTRLS